MAQQYDGSIRIDTKINQAGFHKGIAGIQGSVNRLGISLKSLAVTVGAAFGVAKIVQFGKEAIGLASDLNEVQNVVETAFGSMSTQVDAWAKNSIKQFGMSELAAKQMASTYMAMSVGSGLQGQGAADMAMKAAERAADISSFYNKTLEESDTMLKSIWTGETESLKQIGVVMTQTNLDAFALANGFGKTTSEMTQSEQIMLRYQYVMEQTRLAAGDFVKTQDSWANQTRILSEQWKQFLSIMGGALIQVLTPALQFLNQFMSVLIGWAQTFAAVVSALFGKQVDTAANAMSSAASSADSLAGSTAGAAAAQDDLASSTAAANKELQKQTASFDEMNILQSPSAASGGSSEGAGGSTGGVGVPDLSGITSIQEQIENSISEFEKLIKSKDWAGLGAYIASGINSGLQKVYNVINWDSVRPKVEPFIAGFTETFNSLVYHVDWNLMGRTVGAGINTVVGTLELAISGIDWIALGMAFGEGVNGIFEEVDWYNVGALIGEKFMLAWQTFHGFVSTLDWTQVGSSIATALNGAIENIDLGLIASSISTFVVGLLNAFIVAVQETDWTAVGQQIANALMSIDWGGIASGLFGAGTTLIGGLLQAFSQLPAPVIIAASVLAAFMTVTVGWNAVCSIAATVTTAFGAAVAFLTSPIGLVVLAIGALIAIVVLCIKYWDEISAAAAAAWDAIVDAFKAAGDWFYNNVIKPVGDFFTSLWDSVSGWASDAWDSIVLIWNTVSNWFDLHVIQPVSGFFTGLWDGIKQTFNSVKQWFTEKFTQAKEGIENAWNNVGKFFSGIWDGIKNAFSHVTDWFKDVFSKAWEGVKNVFSTGGKIFDGIKDGIANVFKTVVNGLITGINKIIAAPFNTINGMLNLIRSIDIMGFKPFEGLWGYNPLPVPQIPKLAQGAVIPPNQEMLAILGDQKKGYNLEGPESMFRQIVREESRNGGISGPVIFVLKVGETTLGRATLKSLQDIARQNGGLTLDLR